MKNRGKLIISLVLVLLLAIFAVINMAPTTINFGFTHVKWPLIIVIVITLLLGALLDMLLTTSLKKHQ